jgi:MATE family multidrug resistance protein
LRNKPITFSIKAHKKLLYLAFPLILANITTPLLGLVDTAILGRMEDVSILAGAAIGGLIITQLYWVCGFIKMSITGLSAQTINSQAIDAIKVLFQGIALAIVLAMTILIMQSLFVKGGLYFAQASEEVSGNVQTYFYTRVWGAPAALINMVLIGWLIGHQKTKYVLMLQVIINLANIMLSLLFVYGLGFGVKGVAAATVFAEYLMMFSGFFMIQTYLNKHKNFTLFSISGQSRLQLSVIATWFTPSQLHNILSVNSYMFARNLILQFTLAFITLKGAQYGTNAAAVNAIIMQFFALIALGLDGVANAVEALIGEAKSRKDKIIINSHVKVGLMWSSMFAVVYALFFYLADSLIINLLTHHEAVVSLMADYTFIIVLIPLISHWCYLFDGVFVGLSLGKPMRDSMFVSTVFGFLPTWWCWQEYGNMSLWFAMLVFLSARGLLLGAYYRYLYLRKPEYLT